ncbi:aldo/keto reductase [Streptomyces chartreusis]|uniref:aldo/keto reductase n=1 Tax=Streptomyces chartreusis TaxID=1969 RepID=UPI0033E4D428
MTNTNTNSKTTSSTFNLGGDLPVSRIGYGTMRLADGPDDPGGASAPIWTPPADRAAAIALLREAVELGVNLVDTADAYALGAGEELVAEALHPYGDAVAVSTKVGVLRPSPTEWVPLGHPSYLRQQAELSLRRLRTDRIDLLHLHRLDPAYPIADQVGALVQLQQEGKVRHIGLSEVTVEQLEEARRTAPIAAVQNLYNLAARDHEDVVDHTAAHGIAFLPFFPVAMGGHAGLGSPVGAVAAELGITPAQAALAWLLRRSPNLVPIPGTGSTAHLAENMGALGVEMSADQFQRLADTA